jgi:hypothetical protein
LSHSEPIFSAELAIYPSLVRRHKLASGRRMRVLKLSGLVLIWWAMAAFLCGAQERGVYQASSADQQEEPTGEAEKKQEDNLIFSGVQSLLDDISLNVRNHAGFSLGIYGSYTNNVFPSGSNRQPSYFAAFNPRVFFNLGKRKSQLHLDFGGEYRAHKEHSDFNSFDYNGGLTFVRQLSKRTSLQISDTVSSTQYGYGLYASPIYSPLQSLDFTNEIIGGERTTRNGLIATLDYGGRKSHVAIFTGLQTYKYYQSELGNANAIEAGTNLDYRITKWLSFTNSFTTYLNNPDESITRDTRIHRLQIGGMDFRLGSKWRVSAGGGVEYADYQQQAYVSESANAGLSYLARKTSLALSYHHGMQSVSGLNGLFYSDGATATLGRRMTNWATVTLSSGYYRSKGVADSGLIELLSGNGALEFALRPDIVASLNYSYQNQHSRNLDLYNLAYNRYVASVGLQYIWPATRQ